MAQSTAMRRLRREYADLRQDPVFAGIWVEPLESNFLHAHFLLSGVVFDDTPYEGGVYHGRLKFPPAYPLCPPSVKFYTPSGRFQPNQRICYSFSDFHPELWNPVWSIRTILTGLVSFMNAEELTTGGMEASSTCRVQFAKNSLRHCMESDETAIGLFGKQLDAMAQERSDLNDDWPPPRNVRQENPPPAESVVEHCRHPHNLPSSSTEDNSKTSAKNKKKREKEKRRKRALSFLDGLRAQVPAFVSAVTESLCAQGIDVSDCTPDHVCWRTETLDEYTTLVEALRASETKCTMLIESEIGGRLISTFRLTEGISVLNGKHSITVVEIPAPKEERPYSTGLDHVEFVIPSTANISPMNDTTHKQHLQHWMDQYSASLNWNTKAISKLINPDISLLIDSVGCVKFHLVSLDSVIEFEKRHT